MRDKRSVSIGNEAKIGKFALFVFRFSDHSLLLTDDEKGVINSVDGCHRAFIIGHGLPRFLWSFREKMMDANVTDVDQPKTSVFSGNQREFWFSGWCPFIHKYRMICPLIAMTIRTQHRQLLFIFFWRERTDPTNGVGEKKKVTFQASCPWLLIEMRALPPKKKTIVDFYSSAVHPQQLRIQSPVICSTQQLTSERVIS